TTLDRPWVKMTVQGADPPPSGPPLFCGCSWGGGRNEMKAMTTDQNASQREHGVTGPRRRSPAGGVGAGLSIVVPVYNEAAGLPQLHAAISAVATALRRERGLACEIVYVDDGSRDASLEVAESLPVETVDVQVLSLSRNFGKEAALLAGLDHARKGAVLFM